MLDRNICWHRDNTLPEVTRLPEHGVSGRGTGLERDECLVERMLTTVKNFEELLRLGAKSVLFEDIPHIALLVVAAVGPFAYISYLYIYSTLTRNIRS